MQVKERSLPIDMFCVHIEHKAMLSFLVMLDGVLIVVPPTRKIGAVETCPDTFCGSASACHHEIVVPRFVLNAKRVGMGWS